MDLNELRKQIEADHQAQREAIEQLNLNKTRKRQCIKCKKVLTDAYYQCSIHSTLACIECTIPTEAEVKAQSVAYCVGMKPYLLQSMRKGDTMCIWYKVNSIV